MGEVAECLLFGDVAELAVVGATVLEVEVYPEQAHLPGGMVGRDAVTPGASVMRGGALLLVLHAGLGDTLLVELGGAGLHRDGLGPPDGLDLGDLGTRGGAGELGQPLGELCYVESALSAWVLEPAAQV